MREALRELWVWTLVGCVLLGLLVPAVADLGIAVQSRATLDGVLGGSWLWTMLAALRLGTLLSGDGLRAYVVPGVGETRWLSARGLGYGVVLAAMISLLLGVSLLLPAARVPGILLHGGVCWLEGWVWMWGVAWLSVWARPWLAAGCAACLGLVGHLEHEVVAALGMWGLGRVGRGAMLLLPSFDRTDVQGLLVAGAEVPTWSILAGALQLVCWSLVLAGATSMGMARRDRLP